LDSIHENWSLALTISKILISIQSLLTVNFNEQICLKIKVKLNSLTFTQPPKKDPYTFVCMEQEIGRLYKTNREQYERNARIYTWKYAMTDYISFNQIDSNLFEYLRIDNK
jgi:ubiquitin-protein ligase